MAEPKTKPTDADVDAFLAAIDDPARRADCLALSALMAEVTGERPVLWGTAIVGFGSFVYHRAGGGKGYAWFPVGFANRKSDLTLYLMGGQVRRADLLARLGRHKVGGGCLYVKRLADVDQDVLREMIAGAYAAPLEGLPHDS